MISTHITEFYDDLFQYHYIKLKDIDKDPVVMPIAYISFCQMANILTILILIYFMTDLNIQIDKKYIPQTVLPLYLLFSGINFYMYEIKRRRKKILARKKEIDEKIKLYSRFYLIFSISAPLLLIYFFNEIY